MSSEQFRTLVWIAIGIAVVAWLMYAWTATTGLTVATRYREGRNASARDVTSAREFAVITTLAAVALLLVSRAKKR